MIRVLWALIHEQYSAQSVVADYPNRFCCSDRKPAENTAEYCHEITHTANCFGNYTYYRLATEPRFSYQQYADSACRRPALVVTAIQRKIQNIHA